MSDTKRKIQITLIQGEMVSTIPDIHLPVNGDLLHLTITDPARQMDCACAICDLINGPVMLDYNDRPLIIMPYAYYCDRYETKPKGDDHEK